MKVLRFLMLVLAAIIANYYMPDFVASAFFLGLLLVYFKWGDEAFFLAFFLVLADGAFGFFGRYEANITIIPGLPSIEVAQFYIILSIIKARTRKPEHPLFFSFPLTILIVYLVFLLLQGFTIGISPKLNVYFRLVKILLPLGLIYSLPRLMTKEKDYANLFRYLFPVAFGVLAVQIFTISTGQTPMHFFGATAQDSWFARSIDEDTTYRGFFNAYILIMTLLGALYFLAKRDNFFSFSLLVAVLVCNFFSVFLSATRSWIISFSVIGLLAMVTILKVSVKRVFALIVVGGLIIFSLSSIPIIKIQLDNAMDRVLTVEALAKGDVTAGGTLSRLNVRGPRVMKRWAESPLTGWGFSDYFFRYSDLHVGNQNVLMHSGIIGYGLLIFFFTFFILLLWSKNRRLPADHPYKNALLAFVVVFFGWFLLHSSGFQQFGYFVLLTQGISISVFLCFAALIYHQIDKENQAISPESDHEKKADTLYHVADRNGWS